MLDVASWMMIFVCLCNVHKHWFFIIVALCLIVMNIMHIRKVLKERNKDIPLIPDNIKIPYTILVTLQVVAVIVFGCTQYNPVYRYEEIESKCDTLYGQSEFDSLNTVMKNIFVLVPDSVTDKFMVEYYDAALKNMIIEFGSTEYFMDSGAVEIRLRELVSYARDTQTKQMDANIGIISCVYLIAIIVILDSAAEKIRKTAINKLTDTNVIKEDVNEESI